MVTIMETEEMKQVNEEILNRWRATGFLRGLKEGSINEWRCAKSFDNVANYLLNSDIESYVLTVLAFPFVRRVLCTGKKRMHRILTGEEVCDFLTEVTVEECLSEMESRFKTPLGKTLLGIFKNYVEYAESYEHAKDSSIVDFLDGLKRCDTYYEPVFVKMMSGVFDYEAELLCAATDIFVERNIKKEKEG
jgi:hypothetical protein